MKNDSKLSNDELSLAITYVNKLRQAAFRKKERCVIVEGIQEFRRAREAKVPIKVAYYCSELLELDDKELCGIEVVHVSKDIFARMAFGDRLKGIIGIFKPFHLQLDQFKPKDNGLYVILEEVEKPGNLGGILRTCDGAGVDAVIVCEPKTDIFNQHVVRSSIGTVFSRPVIKATREETARFLSQHEITLFTATSRAEKRYDEVSYKHASALMLGNEHSGITSYWETTDHTDVKIPMLGVGGCLNVAASAAIILYEAVRQRTLNVK